MDLHDRAHSIAITVTLVVLLIHAHIALAAESPAGNFRKETQSVANSEGEGVESSWWAVISSLFWNHCVGSVVVYDSILQNPFNIIVAGVGCIFRHIASALHFFGHYFNVAESVNTYAAPLVIPHNISSLLSYYFGHTGEL